MVERQVIRISNGTVTEKDCIVIGNANKISGENCTVEGEQNIITGKLAEVWGDFNLCAGDQATVYGNHNIVTGCRSLVYGLSNTVEGKASLVYPPLSIFRKISIIHRYGNVYHGINTPPILPDVTYANIFRIIERGIPAQHRVNPASLARTFTDLSGLDKVTYAPGSHSGKQCIICTDRPSDIAAAPCGHKNFCAICVLNCAKEKAFVDPKTHKILCPVCNTPVDIFLKVFE